MENFIPLTKKLSTQLLNADFETAVDFDKAAVGVECFYFLRFAGIEYLPLTDILAVGVRIEGIDPRQCCNTSFDIFKLRIRYADGTAECRFPYELQLREICELLRKKLPARCFSEDFAGN